MAVSGISPEVLNALNGGVAGPAVSTVEDTDEALRNNFMALLITQLQNQDPLKPMENAELTSQLAQINTVSGINTLNDTLNAINQQIDATQSLQAAQLIGSGVLTEGKRILVGEEGASTPFGVELNEPVQELTAVISNSAGDVLAKLELGAVDRGVRSFVWDGKLDNGQYALPGAYQVTLEAVNGAEDIVAATALSYAVVHGVSTGKEGGVMLDLGGLADPVTLDEIRQIL